MLSIVGNIGRPPLSMCIPWMCKQKQTNVGDTYENSIVQGNIIKPRIIFNFLLCLPENKNLLGRCTDGIVSN